MDESYYTLCIFPLVGLCKAKSNATCPKNIYIYSEPTPPNKFAPSPSAPHQDPNLTPGPAAANAAGAAEEAAGTLAPPRVDLMELVIGKNSQ